MMLSIPSYVVPPTLYIYRGLRASLFGYSGSVPSQKKAGKKATSTAGTVTKRNSSFICQTDPKTFAEMAEKEGRWLHVRVEGCGRARSAKTRYHMHLMVEVYKKAPSLHLFPPFLPSLNTEHSTQRQPSIRRTIRTTKSIGPKDQKDDKPIGPKDQKDDKIHRTQGPKGRQNP